MKHFLSQIRIYLAKVITVIGGEVCLSCEDNFGFLCETCLDKLFLDRYLCCRCCSIPLTSETEDLLCGTCLKNPPPFLKIYAPFIYEGAIRTVMHAAKFEGKSFYLKKLFNIAKSELKMPLNVFTAYDAIIPVPVSKKRLLERGFNQSLILAKQLGKAIGKPVLSDLLTKNKDTKPQTTFGRKERFENVKNAFSLKKNLNFDKVILVDDIVTTTATVREVSKVLKLGGAKEILVFALARTKE